MAPMIKIIGVRQWAVAAVPVITGGVLVAALVHGAMTRPAAPPPAPPACADSARIDLGSTSGIECPAGARLEVYPAGDHYTLFKCTCPGPGLRADAGAR